MWFLLLRLLCFTERLPDGKGHSAASAHRSALMATRTAFQTFYKFQIAKMFKLLVKNLCGSNRLSIVA